MPLTLMCNVPLKLDVGHPPSILAKLDLPDSVVGKRVRIIACDEQIYRAGPIGRVEGAALKNERSAPLVGKELEAPFEAANGILWKAEGTIAKTKTGKLFLSGVTVEANPNAGDESIDVKLWDDHDRTQSVKPIAWDRIKTRFEPVRTLLFRVADVSSGEVMASASVLVHVDARGDKRPIGGDGGPRPGDKKTTRRKRSVAPDLTGLYEALPQAEGEGSPLMLFLNQAGHMIVGWFSPPPSFIRSPAVRMGVVVPEGQHAVLVNRGVLAGRLEKDPGDGTFRFKWVEGDDLDPDSPLVDGGKPGSFEIGGTPDQLLQEILVKLDLKATTRLRFRRIKAGARFSNFQLRNMEKRAREILSPQQIDPAPTTFWAKAHRAVDDHATGADSKLTQLLKQWDDEDNKLQRHNLRSLIARQVEIPNMPDAYKEAYATRQRASLSLAKVQLKRRGEMTYYRALQDVLAQELDVLRDEPIKTPFTSKTLAEAGITPRGDFTYTFTFRGVNPEKDGKGVGLDKLFPKLFEILKQKGAPVKIGAQAFSLDVKKELKGHGVVFDTESPRSITNPIQVGRLFGIFGDIGAGVGRSAKFDGSPVELGPKGSGVTLGTFSVQTAADLQLEDFMGATFNIVALSGPSAGISPFFSASSYSSTFFDMNVPRRQAQLTTNVDKTPEFKHVFQKFPGVTEIKSMFDQAKKPEVSATVFNVALGYGWIVFQRGDEVPGKEPPRPTEASLDAQSPARRETHAFFRQDSSNIDEDQGTAPSVRLGLERFLAVDRALFELPHVSVRTYGYASPEAPAAFNKRLSQDRADAVAGAILDAFAAPISAPITLSDIGAQGLGEEPATSPTEGKLHDPPDDEAGLQQFIKTHYAEVHQWPRWRKVDVTVDGILIAQVRTER